LGTWGWRSFDTDQAGDSLDRGVTPKRLRAALRFVADMPEAEEPSTVLRPPD
jgi:hypothetical protein